MFPCPTSPCLNRDEVALKSLAKYLLDPSHEDRDYAEKMEKLQKPRGDRIILQGMKEPDRDNRETGLRALECVCVTLEKKRESVIT